MAQLLPACPYLAYNAAGYFYRVWHVRAAGSSRVTTHLGRGVAVASGGATAARHSRPRRGGDARSRASALRRAAGVRIAAPGGRRGGTVVDRAGREDGRANRIRIPVPLEYAGWISSRSRYLLAAVTPGIFRSVRKRRQSPVRERDGRRDQRFR